MEEKTDVKPEIINNVKRPKRQWLKTFWGIFPSLLLIALVALIFILSGKVKSKGEALKAEKEANLKKEEQKINVVVADLIPSKIREKINLPGLVQPWVFLNLSSEVNGTVVEKNVNEGDSIKKGDTIILIDSRDYENAYNSAKATFESASASLNRVNELYKSQFSTKSQLDEAVAQVENYKALMDNALLNLERCTVKAPIDGIINRIFVEQGQLLNIAGSIAEILQIDKVKVKVGIPESDVDDVRKINTFNVKIDALGGRIFTAKKHFLSKTAEQMAHLYDLVIFIENPERLILPDMFARVEIIKKEFENSLSVPLYSVIASNDRYIVFVEKDGVAHSVDVELGIQEEGRIQIKKGLNPSDKVIVTGHRNLTDGQNINVVRKEKGSEKIIK
ncbi:MAG: efflux RND transporter periplasmic adaptor subunit [Desulfobacterales bacterium]|nr:efflux RND transporter periplasmic adaptor subunit [Desulfobacterales bacterium]